MRQYSQGREKYFLGNVSRKSFDAMLSSEHKHRIIFVVYRITGQGTVVKGMPKLFLMQEFIEKKMEKETNYVRVG